jgi:hypothetical protein
VRPGTTRQRWGSRFALALDGATKYLVRAAGLASFPQVFTASAWVKPDTDGALSYLCEISDGTSAHQLRILRRGDLSKAVLDVRINDSQLVTAFSDEGALTVGEWQHVAVTRDESDVCRLYLDGVEGATSGIVIAGDIGASRVYIGSSDTPDQMFAGEISQFLIFDELVLIADLCAYPARAWYKYPSCYLALNPGHVADSAAPGGLIHDWHSRGQHFTPTNMVAGDIVAGAP